MRIGVISDTHGLCVPEAVQALAGCAHILHAGDVGDGAFSMRCEKLPRSPQFVAMSTTGRLRAFPYEEQSNSRVNFFYMVHRREDLDLHPHAAGIAAVIFGHSHQPEISRTNGVLYFNPGSAGPRRFHLPLP